MRATDIFRGLLQSALAEQGIERIPLPLEAFVPALLARLG